MLEEEDGYGVLKAAEPAVAYAIRENGSMGIAYLDKEAEILDSIPKGAFGFYTDDSQAFEKRVAEIEADIDEVDAGIEDSDKWIEISDFQVALRKEHPWL